ncbi:MAG: radical SAM protein, partial [PVC group bacterium]
KGLIYKKKGSTHINEVAIIKDLDQLPFPAIHLLPLKEYSLANALHPFASIVTARGCPYRCGFCLKDPPSKTFRTRSPKSVVDEIEDRIRKYGAREINFCDDAITVRRTHIAGICNEILERGIKIRWQGPTRIDNVDPELLKLMSRAGCKTLRYGVESGDQGMLDLMKKGITIEQIRSAFKWTKEAKIEIMAYFLIGYVNDTPQTIKKTIAFAKELEPDGAIFSIGTPLPQTDLFKLACKKGLVNKNYWSDFTLGVQTQRIPYLIDDAEEWSRKALWSFYFRPNYIFKRLLKIRTWDALKKHISGALSFLCFKMYKEGNGLQKFSPS